MYVDSRRLMRTFALAGALLTAILLQACSGSSRSLSVSSAAQPGQEVPAPLALPAPAQLVRGASGGTGDRSLDGSEFDAGQAHARTFASGNALSFAPAGAALSTAAYAVYAFDLPDYNGTGQIVTVWDSLPAASDYYIAVADFAANRWQWITGDPAAALTLPGPIDFKSDSGQVYLAVLLSGSSVHGLQQISFGTDQPPQAVLRAQYVFADINTEILFDGSASTDDSSISKFEWDLDGNGTFETDTGPQPTASQSYGLAGSRTIHLRVTDDANQTSETEVQIRIDQDGYDEVEPNNDIDGANSLPGMGFSGWEGNLGEGGYDGGTTDYYKIVVTEPVLLSFELDALSLDDSYTMQLYDETGTTALSSGTSRPGTAILHYVFDTPATYLLACNGGVGPTGVDYRLSCDADYTPDYDEIEPNNDIFQFNEVSGNGSHKYHGNLGTGGYDGGTEDWYHILVAQAGTNYRFTLEPFAGDCEMDLELRDSNDELWSSQNDGYDSISYTFQNSGDYYLRCLVRPDQPLGSSTDYLLSVVNNGPGADIVLTASPDSGAQPLATTLDISGSTLPLGSNIYRILWDYNADGYTDKITLGGGSSTGVTYYLPGPQKARVSVELDTGSGGQAEVDINVSGGGSETEPNNDYDGAQSFGIFPFTDWFGDVGPGGNDGGAFDYYKFTASAGMTATFDLLYQTGLAPMGVALVSWNGVNETVLSASAEMDGSDHVSYSFVSDGTYYLVVFTDADWPVDCGYSLSGGLL